MDQFLYTSNNAHSHNINYNYLSHTGSHTVVAWWLSG